MYSCSFAAQANELRIGLRGGYFFPSSNGSTTVKNDTIPVMLELDVKRSNRLEAGFRLGLDAFAVKASNYYACYDLIMFGYGARLYFDEGHSPETVYHVFKRYIMADAVFSLASKNKDLDGTSNSPQSLLGLGAKVGAGLEYVMGPLSSAFADVEYAVINASAGGGTYEFPVCGLQLAFGVRLAR